MAFERVVKVLIENAPLQKEKDALFSFAKRQARIRKIREMRQDFLSLMPLCYEGKLWGKWFTMINFIIKNSPKNSLENIAATTVKEKGRGRRRQMWIRPLFHHALLIQFFWTDVKKHDEILNTILLDPPFGKSHDWNCRFKKRSLLRKLREKPLSWSRKNEKEFISLFWINKPDNFHLENFKTKEMVLNKGKKDEIKKEKKKSFFHRFFNS